MRAWRFKSHNIWVVSSHNHYLHKLFRSMQKGVLMGQRTTYASWLAKPHMLAAKTNFVLACHGDSAPIPTHLLISLLACRSLQNCPNGSFDWIRKWKVHQSTNIDRGEFWVPACALKICIFRIGTSFLQHSPLKTKLKTNTNMHLLSSHIWVNCYTSFFATLLLG